MFLGRSKITPLIIKTEMGRYDHHSLENYYWHHTFKQLIILKQYLHKVFSNLLGNRRSPTFLWVNKSSLDSKLMCDFFEDVNIKSGFLDFWGLIYVVVVGVFFGGVDFPGDFPDYLPCDFLHDFQVFWGCFLGRFFGVLWVYCTDSIFPSCYVEGTLDRRNFEFATFISNFTKLCCFKARLELGRKEHPAKTMTTIH